MHLGYILAPDRLITAIVHLVRCWFTNKCQNRRPFVPIIYLTVLRSVTILLAILLENSYLAFIQIFSNVLESVAYFMLLHEEIRSTHLVVVLPAVCYVASCLCACYCTKEISFPFLLCFQVVLSLSLLLYHRMKVRNNEEPISSNYQVVSILFFVVSIVDISFLAAKKIDSKGRLIATTTLLLPRSFIPSKFVKKKAKYMEDSREYVV